MIYGFYQIKNWILVANTATKRLLLLGFILACNQILSAQSSHQSLLKGDRQYNLDNYKAAEKHYRIAAELDYGSPKALYNLGNTLYQQGNWEDAAARFAQAAKGASNKEDQANAFHNLGNAYMKLRKFKEAVSAYKNSLRLRPGDEGSKTNLQMAKKKLQEEEQQEKQKQQQQENQEQQPKDDKQDQAKQPQNQSEKQQEQPNDQSKQNQKGTPQPNEQQEQQPSGKLKKEEAQRMLETAVGPEDQRNARKYREAKPSRKQKGTKKDW